MTDHLHRVAIVTGASRGIGAAVAVELARQGACVVVHGRDALATEQVALEIREHGGTAVAVTGPIEDARTSERLCDAAIAEYGQIDTLVTSAGIQTYGDAVSTNADGWRRTMEVNVSGVYLAAHHALPYIRQSSTGSVVIVSSVQATATQQSVLAYTASKGALIAMARSLAVDEAPYSVRVNAVSPGSIDTPMLRTAATSLLEPGESADDLISSWGKAHALGRVGEAREVAEVVSFLVGPRASFVTGTEVRVDGGLLAQLPVRLPESGGVHATH